jgi:hypothetical protein
MTGEVVKLLYGADGVHLNRAVGFIPHPSGDSQSSGFGKHEVAETDTLVAARYNPAPCLVMLIQRILLKTIWPTGTLLY